MDIEEDGVGASLCDHPHRFAKARLADSAPIDRRALSLAVAAA
jgi:hypothetical protein